MEKLSDSDEGRWGVLPPESRKGGRWGRVRALALARLPVLRWAPRYDREAAAADLVAGVTLGLTLVPQSIAYAALANLPVQYGLYSSFIGTILYVFLGTVKEVSIGPTSLMALLTLQACSGLPVQFVVLLTFLSGAVVFAMGLLKLGFMVDLISPSVTSGFTSATAVIIVVAQLKGLLGVSFVAESVVDNLALLVQKAHEVRLGDSLLALACCTVLLALRKLKDVPVSPKRAGVKRALFLVSIGRNAIVVCLCSVLAFCTYDAQNNQHPYFKLSGRVEPGLPPVSVPPFSVPAAGNGTVALGFMDMTRRLSSAIVMLPIVMVLANIAIAKAFSGGQRVDATQEMLTLGLCNMAGSVFHAMPTCGAFTRSAVSHSSGVRTPLAGLYSGLITLTALAFMTQYFFFIPKACLSSVLTCAVIFMIDYATVLKLWRESKAELVVLVLTFATSLLASVELALLAGALAALARLLRRLLRPAFSAHTYKSNGGYAIVARPTLALLYLNTEYVCAKLQALAARASGPLLVDARDLSLVDHSAQQSLERLIKNLEREEQRLVVYNAAHDTLRALQRVRTLDTRALRTTTPARALAATARAPAPAPAPAPAGASAAPAAPLLAHEEDEV
ncbi:hypothetical protein O0L34_g18034 [Tuta absoluta]|nr:hypothetical protein O0L34_g18034 [Tuta absoluta]